LLGIHLRPLLGGFVERIADNTALGAFRAPAYEFVVDFFFDKNAGPGAAALPLIEEQRKMRAFDADPYPHRRMMFGLLPPSSSVTRLRLVRPLPS